MPITEEERRDLTDHDLLIRIDERVEGLTDKVDKMNNVKSRLVRLEVIVVALTVAFGGALAGVNLFG